MGYRALKETEEGKRVLFKRITLCIFVVILLALTIFSCFVPPESWKYHFSKPEVWKRKAGELRMHHVDVGQGDCTIIELPDEKVMLIDGGNGDGSTKRAVLRYLNALDIDVIDYLVVTHTDADHCGSLDEVFRFKKVLNAYLPPSFDIKDVEYTQVYEMASKEEGCTVIPPSRGLDLSNRDGENPYTLTFLYPYTAELGDGAASNGESAVIWLDYFGVSALFCGDASKDVERILIRDDEYGFFKEQGVDLSGTELLKVAHHGSYDSTSAEFLDLLNVQTAIISSGKNNRYGHPSQTVVQRLLERKIAVYRTDMQGHVVVTALKDGRYTVGTIAE